MTWQPQGSGRLVARMKTLAIPPADARRRCVGEPRDSQGRKDRGICPRSTSSPSSSSSGTGSSGRLELAAVPEGRDWRLERLLLANPEGKLTLDGVVAAHAAAAARRRSTCVCEATDIGKLLARLGLPGGRAARHRQAGGIAVVGGAPYELDYPTMSGQLSCCEAAKGQFVKLDPGIGKLLGVLSLQSLPRRVTLDFRDVFSEGFAFDEIIGSATDQARASPPPRIFASRGRPPAS